MRLVLDSRARGLLRRLPRTNVYSAAELLLLAGLAVQCARLFWVLATPIGPLGDWRPVQPGFGGSPSAILSSFDPFFRLSGGDDGKPAVVTSMQLTLFGTRIDEAMGGGSAIIAGPDNVQKSYGVGEEIGPGATLKAVAFDHVTIDRGGAAEDLFLNQSNAVTPVTPRIAPPMGATPSRAVAAPAASVPAGITATQLRSDIGFIPRIDGGKVSGLTVRSQGSGAAFRQAGLRDGDVITSIAGRPVTGPGDLDQLGAQFAKGGAVPISLERGGAPVSIVITIAGQ